MDIPTEEEAYYELFLFVCKIYNNLIQIGTNTISSLYTYYKYLYLPDELYRSSVRKLI